MADWAGWRLWGLSGLLIALPALLSLALAWKDRGRAVVRPLCTWSGAAGLVYLALRGQVALVEPWRCPVLWVSGLGFGAGLWTAWLPMGGRRKGMLTAALLVAGWLLANAPPGFSRSAGFIVTHWFSLSEVVLLATVAALLVGSLALLFSSVEQAPRIAALALGAAFCSHTLALILQGVAAQRAWGAYWSWDALECWHLASWSLIGLSALGARELGWGPRRGKAAVWVTTLLVSLMTWGAPALLRWLGVASAYLVF
jgi:hypothetical protein